jgi:hypothetical protein
LIEWGLGCASRIFAVVIVGGIIVDAVQCLIKVMCRVLVTSKSDLAKNFAEVVIGKERAAIGKSKMGFEDNP